MIKVFSFVPEPARTKIEQVYDNVFFSGYSPDLFDGETNKLIWEQIIEPYTTK